MKLREAGTTVYIVLALFIGAVSYSEYTSADIKELRQKGQKEYKKFKKIALDLKQKYKKHLNDCRSKAGDNFELEYRWKDTTKCKLIKDNHAQAKAVWAELQELDKKLKKADATAEDIQQALKTIEALRTLTKSILERINA